MLARGSQLSADSSRTPTAPFFFQYPHAKVCDRKAGPRLRARVWSSSCCQSFRGATGCGGPEVWGNGLNTFWKGSRFDSHGGWYHPQCKNCISKARKARNLRIFGLLLAFVSTSTRMHGEFLRLLFLQAHRETEAHITAAGMSSQTNNSEALRFKRAAFYNGLKSKVGHAKAASLRIPQCPGLWHSSNPNARSLSHSPSAPPPSFTQSTYPPRSLVRCVMGRLV